MILQKILKFTDFVLSYWFYSQLQLIPPLGKRNLKNTNFLVQ